MLVAGRGSPQGVLLRAGGAEAAGRGWKRQNSRRHSVVVGSLPGIAAYPVGATRRWALRAGPRKAHEGAHRQRELGQRVHAASSYSESSEGASPVSAETRGEAGPSAASDVEPSNPAAERSEENGGKTSAEAADAAGGKEEEAAGTEETSTALPQFTGRWAWLNAAIAVVAAVWGALKRIVQLLVSPFTGMHDRRAAVSNCMMQAAMHGETDPVPVYHLYHTLNAQRQPQKVVELYEAKKYAVNADVAKEYLRALVLTGQIDKYGLPPERGQPHASLARLLMDMNRQLKGQGAMARPGSSQDNPLHIQVSARGLAEAPRSGSPLLSALNSLLRMAVGLLLFSTLWLIGASVVSKAAGGQLGLSLPSSSSSSSEAATSNSNSGGGGGGGSGAGGSLGSIGPLGPKEYNKGSIPKQSVRTFADVKGCQEAKEELEEVVEYLRNPERFQRMGARLPKGLLLTGPPGTGKTLLARAVAGEANVPFLFRAGSEFEEVFVGVGSRRVRALFEQAKKRAPCIVFVDEIDAVGGHRKQWEHSRKTLNQLLTEMDGFEENSGVVVMAATNLPETLDPALTRPGRFDRHIHVALPDVRGREEILLHYLKSKPVADDVHVEYVARGTPGFSGADLCNLVNEAALVGAKTDATTINAAMIEEARDKILMGKERRTLAQTQEARLRTAYHEAGHALVALYTRGADPIHKATIMPRGRALGMVQQLPAKDEFSRSRQQCMAKIDICMGGQVAEALVFGEDAVSTGATSDLRQATSMARHMVQDCGMSLAIGPMAVDSESSVQFRVKADEEVARILKEAHGRVTELLAGKWKELHALARALADKETLDEAQIRAVVHAPAAPEPDLHVDLRSALPHLPTAAHAGGRAPLPAEPKPAATELSAGTQLQSSSSSSEGAAGMRQQAASTSSSLYHSHATRPDATAAHEGDTPAAAAAGASGGAKALQGRAQGAGSPRQGGGGSIAQPK